MLSYTSVLAKSRNNACVCSEGKAEINANTQQEGSKRDAYNQTEKEECEQPSASGNLQKVKLPIDSYSSAAAASLL